ncbi:AMP-binding protein [Prochlorococcus sp. MIT 1307]|uniref:AMP-binding protein n=1 Tax=Prochlorococcus sp. MIT 1307 TaxID=3096219 RepID=UPI002A74B890|nr:AMP-binding protein [Prochlorococcus sp. MIT 1307]
MKHLMALKCNPTNSSANASQLEDAIEKEFWVQLLPKMGEEVCIPNHLLPKGPGVVIASGGSLGMPHHCLQPCSNLDQSAFATGEWLMEQGYEPKNCTIINPLPFHHVSGLMPWWRSRVWGCKHIWLAASLMRDQIALEHSYKSILRQKINPIVISLVPTQINRLLASKIGLLWLQCFDIIWVGGSKLSEQLSEEARRNNIRLAPCYGSTETAAMVTVLHPNLFLSGKKGCGNPLGDVELRLNTSGALEVKTKRLAVARWKDGHLESLCDQNGWWQSGDSATLNIENSLCQVEIHGRLDTAINSGGETIFPETLEARILKYAKTNNLPIQNIILLPISDDEWGQRLIGLVRWQAKLTPSEKRTRFNLLRQEAKTWRPAERPSDWYECPQLSTNLVGKWQRSKWKKWWKNKYIKQ